MSSERTLRIALFAVAAAAVVAVAGCGNKRPPAPPPQIIPARTLDLRIQQRGDELLLSFTYPTTTMGGGALGDLSGVEFWEVVREMPLSGTAPPAADDDEADEGAEEAADVEDAEEEAEQADEEGEEEAASVALEGPAASEESGPPTLSPIDPLEFTAAATVRATLTGAELDSAIQGEKIFARFPLGQSPPVGQLEAHHFAIKTVSGTGLGSPFSNIVNLARRATPKPPAEFEVEPGSAGVELSWFFAGEGPPEESSADGEDEAPEVEVEEITEPEIEFEAFNLYRRSARERNYGSPLARVDRTRREYVDRSARFGEAYIYAVAAVLANDPMVETALSAEREIDFTDRFAPPPPTDLVTLAERDSVRILWDASVADDVDGYILLRATAGGEFTPLNEELIRELEYTDRAVTSGAVYRYRLIAVDQEGNRSGESATSEARVP